MVQIMKKNTILRFMGELSGRYIKLVFPKIEPHKCVKKKKRKSRRKYRERQIRSMYIILIGRLEETREKTDARYTYPTYIFVNKSVEKEVKTSI